jgi:hypothetical protein
LTAKRYPMIKKSAIVVFLVVVVGFLAGTLISTYFYRITAFLSPTKIVYNISPVWFGSGIVFAPLRWEMLVPEQEREILARYQTKEAQTVSDLSVEILNSIKLASDQGYKLAMRSMNTVASLASQTITISGFIVPIDFYPNKDIKHIFLVPYFGACIHFPPPPPNQMLYARLGQGFENFDINQAYTINGKLKIEPFEDLIGTSAYSIEVVSIEVFIGEPDTFRTHSL